MIAVDPNGSSASSLKSSKRRKRPRSRLSSCFGPASIRQRKAKADERRKRAEKLSAPTKLARRDWRPVRRGGSASPVAKTKEEREVPISDNLAEWLAPGR